MHEVEVDLNNIIISSGISAFMVPILVQVLQDDLTDCFKLDLIKWFVTNNVKMIWKKGHTLGSVYEDGEMFEILKYTILFAFKKEEDAILFKITWG